MCFRCGRIKIYNRSGSYSILNDDLMETCRQTLYTEDISEHFFLFGFFFIWFAALEIVYESLCLPALTYICNSTPQNQHEHSIPIFAYKRRTKCVYNPSWILLIFFSSFAVLLCASILRSPSPDHFTKHSQKYEWMRMFAIREHIYNLMYQPFLRCSTIHLWFGVRFDFLFMCIFHFILLFFRATSLLCICTFDPKKNRIEMKKETRRTKKREENAGRTKEKKGKQTIWQFEYAFAAHLAFTANQPNILSIFHALEAIQKKIDASS